MKSITKFSLLLALAISALAISGCSSEPPQTQALYTDAKKMYDEINRAFTLPGRSQERVDLMHKILDEKWDIQVVDKLDQYLKEAPNGKFASDAKKLLDEAKGSDKIRMLGQVRPFLEKTGVPKTAAEADSLAKSAPATGNGGH